MTDQSKSTTLTCGKYPSYVLWGQLTYLRYSMSMDQMAEIQSKANLAHEDNKGSNINWKIIHNEVA